MLIYRVYYKTGAYILPLENTFFFLNLFLKEKLYCTMYENHSFFDIEGQWKFFSKQHKTKYFLAYNE